MKKRWYIAFFGVLLLVSVAIIMIAFSPSCTTFADGTQLCRQLEWGGQRWWRP